MVTKIKAVAASRWVRRDPLESSLREFPAPLKKSWRSVL